MKTFAPLLTLLLTLASFLIPSATAKDKDKIQEELDRDYTAHTWEAHIVNRMVFVLPLDQFMVMWRTQVGESGITGLIWVTDACTGVDDKPLGWNFKPACIRHDFAYKNFKRQGRFHHESRKKIDKNFKKDMYDICAKGKNRKLCRVTAKLYYAGVRVMGRSIAVEPMDTMKNGTGVLNASDYRTTAVDTGSETDVEKRSGNRFADWIADLQEHLEVLMDLSERDLENVGMAIDVGIGEMEKE